MTNISQSSSLLAIAKRVERTKSKKASESRQLPYLKLLSAIVERPVEQVAEEAAAKVPASSPSSGSRGAGRW